MHDVSVFAIWRSFNFADVLMIKKVLASKIIANRVACFWLLVVGKKKDNLETYQQLTTINWYLHLL